MWFLCFFLIRTKTCFFSKNTKKRFFKHNFCQPWKKRIRKLFYTNLSGPPFDGNCKLSAHTVRKDEVNTLPRAKYPFLLLGISNIQDSDTRGLFQMLSLGSPWNLQAWWFWKSKICRPTWMTWMLVKRNQCLNHRIPRESMWMFWTDLAGFFKVF